MRYFCPAVVHSQNDVGQRHSDSSALATGARRAPMIKLVFVLISWVTCGIAAAGIWNASLYENFHNCGRPGAEDQAYFLVNGIVGGPISLIIALRDSDFARSGWSFSTHECAEPVR